MNWMFALLVFAALLVLVRIVLIIRRARRRSNQEDWDARLVRDLRAAGANAFTPYEIDFFFSLPSEGACESLRGALEPEGFATDSRAMSGGASGFSLHARKRLRISAADMQGYSQRFRELAAQFGGQYDGWTTDPSRV